MKNFLFVLFLLCAGSVFAQTPDASDCKQFHTGTFYVKNMPNIVITRDAQFQTETDPSTGKYVKLSVTWLDDCTYQLRLVKTNDRKQKKDYKKIGVLTVTITSADENSYHFSATSPVMKEAVKGVIIKKVAGAEIRNVQKAYFNQTRFCFFRTFSI